MEMQMKAIPSWFLCLLLVTALVLPFGVAFGHPDEPFDEIPEDFITGGGWILRDTGSKANFGVQGGVKNGDWWGGVNFKDHTDGLHVRGRNVTGYWYVYRHIRMVCGTGTSNHFGDVDWRVWLEDHGEPGRDDVFIIRVGQNGVVLYTTEFDSDNTLGNGRPGGGNIKLHKGNRSNVAPDAQPLCGI
jgi:hypothetical protein